MVLLCVHKNGLNNEFLNEDVFTCLSPITEFVSHLAPLFFRRFVRKDRTRLISNKLRSIGTFFLMVLGHLFAYGTCFDMPLPVFSTFSTFYYVVHSYPAAGRINREFRAAQWRGLPLPILWISEYFTLDGEDILWGRSYRLAGYYAWIMVW